MRKRAVLLALMTCLVAAAFAQDDQTEWYLDKPIRDFTFVGLVTVSAAELRPIVRPYIGQPFTYELYDEIQQKLYALDYFDLIEVVPPPTPAPPPA